MVTNGRGDRRTEILDSAAALFAAKGVNGTTVREIADEVGMLSGSLYHHFGSKDEMVEAILTSYVDGILARYAEIGEASPRERLAALIHASIEIACQQPHATEIYQANARQLSALAPAAVSEGAMKIQQTWLAAITAGVEAGELRSDVDPRTFYRLLRDAMWLTVRWYDARRDGYSVQQLADDCTTIFLDGFTAR